jgi:hypothetical protein
MLPSVECTVSIAGGYLTKLSRSSETNETKKEGPP